jgi:hypothetical protein
VDVLDQPDCQNPNSGELIGRPYYSPYAPYQFSWSNGATTETISGLPQGTYTVTITDALGCVSTASTELKNELLTAGNVVCNGGNNGTLSAQLVNGVLPVSYVWSNGQTGANLSNLPGGTYGITATDALGCVSTSFETVAQPYIGFYDQSPTCFAGNNGIGNVWVNNDIATSFLWDNGVTESWNQTLSPGPHTVTVTTSLGCVLTEQVTIKQPLAPPFVFSTNITPADCANNAGGAVNLSISGGTPNFTFYAYGNDGFFTNDINSLQNLTAGSYYFSVSSNTLNGCYGSSSVTVGDAGGFTPRLEVDKLDCVSGYAAAAVLDVTAPNVTYDWSNGATSAAVFNLTVGCYSVTVSGDGSCVKYYEFCVSTEDSLQTNTCAGFANGKLINDLGVPGCTGTTGIPYQLIRTLPSGALNFTDDNGNFSVALPTGTFDIEAANYTAGDIACPANNKHTVNAVLGATQTGLDFHFFNTTNIDHSVRQRALRLAQPGYPYSLRLEVCNDGATVNPGVLDLEYGNFLGAVVGREFAQHPGAFTLGSEAAGVPNNTATFNFPGVAAGNCELLQLDLVTPVTAVLNTPFITEARVSPTSGDPTPDNNISSRYGTIVGAFDPNCVLAFPARNGNPRDGGEILRFEDNTIVYQIFFQNTGNAPADLVVVRDPLDDLLDLNTIRNITATHDMKVTTDEENKTLIFNFANINLPDSTTDYAGSIGSIQYEINLKPGVPLGAKIDKQVGIYFDFNAPVITNENILEVVSSSKSVQADAGKNALRIYPNPTDTEFAFYADANATVRVYNALGVLMTTQQVENGLQRINTTEMPSGVYLVQLDTNGFIRQGKVVVSHR